MADKAVSPRGGVTGPQKDEGIFGGGAPPPPPATSKATGERSIFTKFINAHPSLKKNGLPTLIWQNANTRYGGITPTQLAAVIYLESKGDKNAKSKAGALGVAQIYDNTAPTTNAAGVPFFRPGNYVITEQDKLNPAFAIQYAAWRLSGYASTHGGSIDDIWVGGYNPNYKAGVDGPANPVSSLLPKGYVGTAASTVDQNAGKSVDTSAVTQGMKDPWVVGVSKAGKLIVNSSPVAPKNTILYDGAPLTASGFKSVQRSLDNYFASYTGGRANPGTVLQYIQKGWGTYALTVALSKSKGFANSPIYKKYAPAYQDVGKDLLAPGKSVPSSLIKAGIINGWDSSTFAAVLRKQPGYIQSNEFKSTVATIQNVHQSIMGIPDANSQATIQEAAAAGWKPDQYAAWLRSQPQYTSSPEYQTKTLGFLSALGLITGATPVLKKGLPNPVNPNPTDKTMVPNDPRLTSPHPLTRPEDTVATLNG